VLSSLWHFVKLAPIIKTVPFSQNSNHMLGIRNSLNSNFLLCVISWQNSQKLHEFSFTYFNFLLYYLYLSHLSSFLFWTFSWYINFNLCRFLVVLLELQFTLQWTGKNKTLQQKRKSPNFYSKVNLFALNIAMVKQNGC
jgi:hypothetical protein